MKKQLTIDEVKQIELEILLAFHKFCNENSLQYSLCGGTLLGAIRHKGFIPWDDDIDVFMPRPDYERLREMNRNNFCVIKQNYVIEDYRDCGQTKKVVYPFLKILDKKTLCYEYGSNKRYEQNLWIDIFPIDGLPAEANKISRLYRKIWILRKIHSTLAEGAETSTTKGKKVIKTLILPLLKRIGFIAICKKMDKLSQSYDFEVSDKIAGVVWGYGPQECLNRSDIEPMDIYFEGYKLKGIKGYDTYLRNLYGDYMQLPPEENRPIHLIEAFAYD